MKSFVEFLTEASKSKLEAAIDIITDASKKKNGSYREDAWMEKLGFTVMSDSEFDKYEQLNFKYFSKASTKKLGLINLPDVVTQSDVNVEKVKSIISSKGSLPPIKVFMVNGKYVIVDGHHRAAAYKALGINKVQAELIL